MPPITISLARGLNLTDVPIAVEVVSSTLTTEWKGAISIGQSKATVNLKKGRYAVQATLPSGKTLTQICEVKGSTPAKVDFDLVGASPRESLEWAKISKPAALANAQERETQLSSVWLRLWGRDSDGQWAVRRWPVQMADREPGLVQYEFRFGTQNEFGQYYLQVGGPTMQWRLIALPAEDIRVLITGADPGKMGDTADSAVDVSVASMQPEAEVLLGYLSQGQFDQARVVSDAVWAVSLLAEKRRNPTAAAVGGYFLLTTPELQRIHELWANNLANWMKWLPDGPVIHAWYLLRQEKPDVKQARARLIEAAARGVPVYTRGLRLLLDGLALFQDDPSQGGPDIDAALQRVRRYASTADWRSPTTAFIARTPNAPGKTPLGRPESPAHVVFASAPDQADIAWKVRRQTAVSRTRVPAAQASFRRGSDADAAQARSVALGEADEAPGTGEASGGIDGGGNTIEFSVDAEQRFHSQKSERDQRIRLLQSGRQREADTPERVTARLFRAADLQTDSEQQLGSVVVPLLPGAERRTDLRGVALERILGLSNFLSVSFLERGSVAARTVGKVVAYRQAEQSATFFTGFLVSPRLLLTSHSALSSVADAEKSYVDLDYQDGPNGRLLSPVRITFDPRTFFVTSLELGFTLVALEGAPATRRFGWNPIHAETGKAVIGECLSVIQHADGAPKQVAIRENQLVGVLSDFLHYQSDRAAPSSGAPLFNDQWEVVGMHCASIPRRDPDGNPLASSGSVWTSDMGLHQIDWAGHEGVRVSSVVRYLQRQALTDQQAPLLDEMLFRKPSASGTTP